ncbi:2d9f5e7b-2899-485e-b907-2692b8e25326 [Sclerotinia trifoliorum]|uniref:2d9f5e7b-2899-485e-b907-2692b8e25326 n=1 Tax=Sclerotinia trifoliorum TaxID=28548 RepID=A0A8H2ZNP2_9HELO|nr:2d9f5e7b-2899-485e-b907-2692b8e25326 [Sclerotinia trifoliorum]
MRFLQGIDIEDAEEIRRVVRSAKLPAIGEFSGYPRPRLDNPTGPLTSVERRAVQDIEQLWMLGKEYRKHINRLIQDCDIIPHYIIVKAAKATRKYIDSLRAQGYSEHIQDLELVDADEPQIMKDTTTMPRKRSASSQEISKNVPAKKQNVSNREEDKMDTPVDGLVPAKTGDGKENIHLPKISSYPAFPTTLKKLKNADGLGTEDLKAITRTRNKRQVQRQSNTIDQILNTNRKEQTVDKTGIGSNESDLSFNSNATTNDSGDSIKPKSSSRLIKELTAYNSSGGKESEDTVKQTRGRSTRQSVRTEEV